MEPLSRQIAKYCNIYLLHELVDNLYKTHKLTNKHETEKQGLFYKNKVSLRCVVILTSPGHGDVNSSEHFS